MRALEPGDPRSVGPNPIAARLGSGGMATVYFGHTPGGLRIAVKVMHADLARDRALRERFRQEVAAVRVAGGRWSPAYVSADVGAPLPWLATEYLPAISLREAVERFGALRPATVWVLAAALAEALRSIHTAGISHLDLKPGNVLLTADGPRLIDYGIARAAGAPAGGGHGGAGSPGYMSPEQLYGAEVGPKADVYALGTTLAFAWTGRRPEPGTPAYGIDDAVMASVVADCTKPDPAGRPDAAELSARLATVLEDRELDPMRLPSELAAEIDERARAAAHPPAAIEPLTRRNLLIAGLGALAVTTTTAAGAGLGLLVEALRPGSGRAVAGPLPATGDSASPGKRRVLEFSLSGDVDIPSITYTVGTSAETVRDAKLPWRVQVDVPALPRKTAWKLVYRQVPGNIRMRVYIDGFLLASGESDGAVPVRDVEQHGEA
jgi:hypothetical protein